MSIDFDEHGYQKVKSDDYFHYDCSGCGDCCRNVKDSVMLESLDLYRLARFLGMEMSEVCLQYTDTAFLAWGFPVLMLKTKQHMDACIFLKVSRCSVHEVKPRTCRTYPLGIGPDDKRPGEWLHLIVSKKRHHFTGQRRRVGSWMNDNLTPGDLTFIAADYNHTGELAKLMKRIDKRREDEVLKMILFYKYIFYDTVEDFTPHGKNILSTSKPKYHQVERIANLDALLVDLDEAWDDFMEKFHKAVLSDEKIWHVINSQTALGKTEAILKLLKDTPLRVLIAVPTNKLKREVCERAKGMGIDIIVSPSLHELKDDLPDEVWDDIETLYDAGKSPMPRLNKAIAEDDLECAKLFKQYKRELDEFTSSDGHAITTHRRLTSVDVSKYDLVIIDEDIIYSTIIPGRDNVPISKLEKLKKKLDASDPLAAKIKKILKLIKKEDFFTLKEIDYDRTYADIKMAVNIPALCSATYFCYRKASGRESDLDDNCVSFIKPVKFQKETKYIMLSATADKAVCEYCFGEGNVKFYACKEARLTGTLNQFGNKSMGRGCMSEDISIISRIKKWSGFEHTISFKKFLKYYEGDMYYGNCAGCDTLKNKNIDVIGTPHQPEWIYKLFAYSLGFGVDVKLKPNTTVTHNGYRFRFRTYDDKALRDIQFYMQCRQLSGEKP